MELRQLRYFAAVAEELHFGRAAERLQMSQPPLTVTIQKLEAELGVPLLERDSGGVRLTAAGAVLLEDARQLLAAADRAGETARRVARDEQSVLELAFSQVAMRLVAPDLTLAMRQHEPQVTLEASELSSGELSRSVRDGALDAGFGLYPEAMDGLVLDVVRRDRLYVALPLKHELCSTESVPAAALASETLLLFPRPEAPQLHDHLLRNLRRAGLEPRLDEHGGLAGRGHELVAMGHGVALTTWHPEATEEPSVTLRPLQEPYLAVNTTLVWRAADPSPAVALLLSVVSELVAAFGWLVCTPAGGHADRLRRSRGALLRFTDLKQAAAAQLERASGKLG